ncbi:MAG: hypothetical protein GYA21_14510 [Myxococcales bacterium]|nr:hypothetical protein [Myxococcales bacterium]
MNDNSIASSNPPSDSPKSALPLDEAQAKSEISWEVRQCLASGNFARARLLVRSAPPETPPEKLARLAEHARGLAIDPAAWLVACAVGAALVATAAVTLFH